MAALQGYRTQQKIGQSQYQTYQQVGRAGSGSYAADTVSKVLWDTTPLNVPVEAGSTKLIINATAHTALPGDMLRFIATSANPGIEVGVVSVTNNTITLGGELPALPLLADEFKIMRWITPTADQNGNLVFTPGPTTYNLNGVITTVAQDTANAANNRALPALVTYIENGVQINVLEDTANPANNKPLPVKLTGVTGDVIINAGDLNVSTNSLNDSMALGDAVTGDKANVRLNDDATIFALKTKDDDANTKLAAIQAAAQLIDDIVGASGSASAAAGARVLGTDGTNDRQVLTDSAGRVITVTQSSALPTGAATEAAQTTGNGSLATIASNTAGLATQATLAAIAAQLPANLGSKADAASFAVTASTEDKATQNAIKNAVEILDNIVSGSEAQVDIVSAGPILTEAQFNTLTGAVNETAPTNDTASSGLNGRLQRIAQRLTSLIGLLPAALGQQNMAGSLSVAIASNQSVIPVSQSRVMNSQVNFTAAGDITPPANAKGFVIQNSTRAAGALRFAAGSGVATASVGFLLEPGQSTSYQDGAPSVLSIGNVDSLALDGCVIWYV